MAYNNFIPTVWAEGINRELEKKFVFAEDCNRKYEGDVKEFGDQVRILGVGSPTITDTEDKDITLGDPEKIEDTSATLIVDHISHFNYKVGDIDKAQAKGNILEALHAETSEKLADKMDAHIASLANDASAILDAASAYQATADIILEKVDTALQKLYENNVSPSADIIMTVTPRFYMLMKRAYASLDTNNSGIIKNGKVGMYGGITVKMSNNVATASAGAVDKIMVRTKRAIAFVNPMTHVEPYRPEKGFADAVKGFVLYKAKIIRPKEMIVMNVKYTA